MTNTQHATRHTQIPAGPAAGLPNPFPAWVKTAGVFAPAGAVTLERRETGCRQLADWGLHVETGGEGEEQKAEVEDIGNTERKNGKTEETHSDAGRRTPDAQIQPSALSPQPSTFSLQPSALSPQPLALSLQPSAFSLQPSAFSLQPSAFSLQPSALSPQPSALSLPPAPLSPHRFFSGHDAARLETLHALLRSPQVDVLLPLRGGYGCARLLDGLDRDLVRRAGKPLVGYSDVTALHLAFFACGVRNGLSGPMPGVEFARELPDMPGARDALAFTLRSFAEAWTPRAAVSLPPDTRLEVLKPGCAQAPVVPVNLTVLLTLAGTRHMPDLAGTILVVEDVNEPAHAIDRDLNHLRQLGVLERLAGLVFGRFTKAEDAQWLPEIFAEYSGFVNGPVVGGFPYGHEMPLVTVPVGRGAMLAATADGTVSLSW